jgi:TetR/AcrR family transcriptional regulator, transcriptional repressor for nem operon
MARPRQFDEDAVLDIATDAFWKSGFEATSTRNLTSSSGLAASSLYMAFGDKRDLYRLCLDNYLRGSLHEKAARLEAAPDPALAITTFFHEIVLRSLSDPERRGCLMVNTIFEASAGDDSLSQGVVEALAFVERFFLGRLRAAQSAGRLAAEPPLEDVARHLLSVLLGVRVLARIRPEEALMNGAVDQALRAAGLPPLPRGPTK